MGKHKSSTNQDPIIKKDYKYEKRKKMRAQEREERNKRSEEATKLREEMLQIEHKVDQEIKRELSLKANNTKSKTISKFPKGLLGKNKEAKSLSLMKGMLEKKEHLCFQEEEIDYYGEHFAELPPNIETIRLKQESKKEQIDREVSNEVRRMFSIQEGIDEEKLFKEPLEGDSEKQDGKERKEYWKPTEEDEFRLPHVLVKQSKADREVVMQGDKPHLMSAESYQRKTKMNDYGDIRKNIIKSYRDYLHIENKEEQTIEEFRGLIIDHICEHENRCRKDSDPAKGFTNAKALILCPFFGDARSIIQLLKVRYSDYEIMNEEKLDEVEDENDFFRIGISVNERKKCLKFFTSFKVSNLILASPVGIKAIVGSEGESHRDYSFLSSVEILYIDRASTILMQNWNHLVEVMKNLNLMPNSDSITNPIDTFRHYIPELKARVYRQSIIFTEYNFPEMNALKQQHLHNWEGCITTRSFYEAPRIEGEKQKVEKQFFKMEINQAKEDLGLRFEFFKRKFWDQIHNNDSMNKIVIFVRSYFEFVKVKEFLLRANASADFISEHTHKSKVQSRVAHFMCGKFRMLLLSERAYYYGVCEIKNFHHLYMYSLPQNAWIYDELVRSLVRESKLFLIADSLMKNKMVTIYNKYDLMYLERVVGSRKAQEMIREFCSNVSFLL